MPQIERYLLERNHSVRRGFRTSHFMVLLFIVAVGVSGFIQINSRGFALSPRYLGEILGGGIALALLPGLIVLPWRMLERRRGQETAAPLHWGSIVFIGFAVLAVAGSYTQRGARSADREPLTERDVLPNDWVDVPNDGQSDFREVLPNARSDGSIDQPIFRHVDRANGFSVFIGTEWTPVVPNEFETKLLLIPVIGQRCWVTVVDNPKATEAILPQITNYLVSHPEMLQAALSQVYHHVTMASPKAIVLSGSHPAALFQYSGRYSAFDKEVTVSAIEAHLPVVGRTYKVGCSTTENDLNGDFRENVGRLLRTFQLIPARN